MEEQTGLTGLYSACEYHVSDPTLDTRFDKKMDYIWEQSPISRNDYTRSEYDYNNFMKAIVHCVAVMMHEYQMYHIDMPTALGLLQKIGESGACSGICTREIMRYQELICLIPDAGNRYETVCIYLETLMRLQITETEGKAICANELCR